MIFGEFAAPMDVEFFVVLSKAFDGSARTGNRMVSWLLKRI